MHPLIEKDHQDLIGLLEILDQCVLKGDSVGQVSKYLDAFVNLAADEFKNEEKLMQEYRYPNFIEHKKEHAHLLDQLHSVYSQLKQGHTPFGKEYMHWLRDWFETHLLDADNQLDEFLYQANADKPRLDKPGSNKHKS